MTPVAAVLVDVAVWAAWGTSVGWLASRVPDDRLPRTPTARWERRLYERIGVRRWKRFLPEAGAVFGGISKRRLPSPGRRGLVAYEGEARRAELVHVAVPAAIVVFPLWNPWPVTVLMAGYAAAANLPCLVAIRYNRTRIAALVPC